MEQMYTRNATTHRHAFNLIFIVGKRPYKGVTGLVELHSKLKEGERLEKPPHCSEELELTSTFNILKSKS
ncbi:hypothetical protein OS493_038363 [Desmophyllum pertusum]|uniref:Uncharacterized protein n=1 Tax=Desmophyllum pertusum TaxID=174260 RepID=A0A9X0D1Y5_9CNID|nr:hypothetical protein OS493_038359 [Desmophyllum pertusum]KAJ7381903.1 hypothetical protein OS493_038363 [Desmophyllum pertusum]